MKHLLIVMAAVGILHVTGPKVFSGQLPAGTTLAITSGSWSAVGVQTMLLPGTDGGIVVGLIQASGGQELTAGINTPGEIDAAWSFFGTFGTDYTAAPWLNSFAASTCTSGLGTTRCYDGNGGFTTLGSWNIAWNGQSYSAGGGVVDNWNAVTLNGMLISWALDYRQTIQDFPYNLSLQGPTGLQLSGPTTGPMPYSLHLEGTLLSPSAVPEPGSLVLLGTGSLALGAVLRRIRSRGRT